MLVPTAFALGDTGAIIRLTVEERDETTGEWEAVDISGATLKELVFRTPRGNKLVKTATFTNAGTDGKLQYTTDADFFNVKDRGLVGTWQVQPKLEGVAGWSGRPSICTFRVVDILG